MTKLNMNEKQNNSISNKSNKNLTKRVWNKDLEQTNNNKSRINY